MCVLSRPLKAAYILSEVAGDLELSPVPNLPMTLSYMSNCNNMVPRKPESTRPQDDNSHVFSCLGFQVPIE